MLSHTVLLWVAGRGPVWPLAAVGRIARGWVPALLLAAQCSPHILLTELQAMLKGVSEGKSLGPSAILPRAHSQVRGWGGVQGGQWDWAWALRPVLLREYSGHRACVLRAPTLWLQNRTWGQSQIAGGNNVHLCFRPRLQAPSILMEAAAVMQSSVWLPRTAQAGRPRSPWSLLQPGPAAWGRRGRWGHSLQTSASKTSCRPARGPSSPHALLQWPCWRLCRPSTQTCLPRFHPQQWAPVPQDHRNMISGPS